MVHAQKCGPSINALYGYFPRLALMYSSVEPLIALLFFIRLFWRESI